MAEQTSQERTEAPTQRRREEARNRGQVAVSGDLTQAAIVIGGAGLLWLLSRRLANTLIEITRRELSGENYDEWSINYAVLLMQAVASRTAETLLPLLGIMVGIAVGIVTAQVGLRLTFEPLRWQWSRISLTQGWDRLFSLRSVMRGVMVGLKLGVGMSAISIFLWSQRREISMLGRQSLGPVIADTWTIALQLILVLGAALFAIGAVDYLFQRWQHERDLKMTRQEIRDEQKREDGDPQIKSRMRRLARESLKMRMLKQVPEAAVILTNPTHIAVALKYDRDSMEAPRVIAKGTDAFAKRIVAIAKDHDVPVVERKPLARALYATVEVDQEIPASLYRAIAEILAHLYEIRRPAA